MRGGRRPSSGYPQAPLRTPKTCFEPSQPRRAPFSGRDRPSACLTPSGFPEKCESDRGSAMTAVPRTKRYPDDSLAYPNLRIRSQRC